MMYQKIIPRKNIYTNITVMSAPHRNDLSPFSCVSSKVQNFNRKMKKIMKIFPHLITMDIDLERKHFTTHDLHMNSRGKCEIAQKIATQITDVATTKKEKKPIIMPWDPETDVRHRTGEDTNQKRIQESVDITPLSSATSSPQKQPNDIVTGQ
jgi:hypothetical protein